MPRISSPFDHLPPGWIDRVTERADSTGVDVYGLGAHIDHLGLLVITYETDDPELGQADVGLLIAEALAFVVGVSEARCAAK